MMDIREFDELQRRAEEILAATPMTTPEQINEADYLKMMHEIAVYRIELELQQEELRLTKEKSIQKEQELKQLSELHSRFILHYVKNRKSFM